jgi:hypothetical protein
METENLNPQIPPEVTPPNKFPKLAIILGVFLVTAIAVGIVFYFKSFKPITQNQSQQLQQEQSTKNNFQSPAVIYGDIKVDENDEFQIPTEVVFYSVNPNTKEQKQLFTISADKIGIYDFLPHIQFCAATNKIYIRTSRLIKETPYQDLHVKEVDLSGNIRDLNFTGTVLSDYKNWEHYDTGFALSGDCQKIVWSTTYYQYTNYQETGAVNEIVFADINGGGKKVLQTIKRSSDNTFGKELKSWSVANPNVVYLTNYDWTRNGRGGGLFKLDLSMNSITQIDTIPTGNIIWDISNNDNLVAHQQNFLAGSAGESFVTNLANKSTIPMENKSNGKRKFFADNSKLGNTMPVCSGVGAEAKCVPNLYLFDLVSTNKLIALGVELKDWLTNNSVVGAKDDKDLVLVNVDNGKEDNLGSVSNFLLFIGVSGK